MGELAILLVQSLAQGCSPGRQEAVFGCAGTAPAPMTASACSRSAIVAVRRPLTLSMGGPVGDGLGRVSVSADGRLGRWPRGNRG